MPESAPSINLQSKRSVNTTKFEDTLKILNSSLPQLTYDRVKTSTTLYELVHRTSTLLAVML